MRVTKTILLAAGVLLTVPSPWAVAQTAKPPATAKPAAAAAPAKTLSGKPGAAGRKLMTREELRSCLQQLEATTKSGRDITDLRPGLDRERDELQRQGEALKAERAEVDRLLAAVHEWQARMRAHSADVDAFNKRSAAVQDAPSDQRQALLAALQADRARLQQERETLAADEAARVPPYQQGVKAYNERAAARDAKVVDWNQRNGAAAQAAAQHEQARLLWLDECADRPYLEDDEMAIKAGK